MKRMILFLTLLSSVALFAQPFPDPPRVDKGQLLGGFGMTWVDDKPHYNFRISPDITFKEWGLGLDLNLEFDSDFKLRDENFKDFADYLSVIRYIRYGQKNDPVFAKIGVIDNYTLGFGNIISTYGNSPSFDNRKVGLVVDVDMQKWGFESIYSDFSQGGVFGARAFVRPLQLTGSKIPILGDLEVGLSVATDLNKNAGAIAGSYDTTAKQFNFTEEKDVTLFGADIGLPLFSNDFFGVELFGNYSMFSNYGSGFATGIEFEFNSLGIVQASAVFERRFNNHKFSYGYFGTLYELERFQGDTTTGTFISKAQSLEAATTKDNGFFGSLYVSVVNTFEIFGSYEKLDKTPNSGVLQIRSEIAPKDAPMVLRLGYDKVNIIDNADVFTLDDRSHFYTEAGYKPMEYLLVSVVYHWTFAPIRDADDAVVGYETQKRIEPRVTFIYPFDM